MNSGENSNWAFDPSLIADIAIPGVDFGAGDAGCYWTTQGLNVPSNASVQIDSSLVNSDGPKEASSCKRARPESCAVPHSKACREKMRRDKLNDKFLELGSVLEPGKPPKMDKGAILSDAVRVLTQLRNEAQKLKDSNQSLEEKIKELKAEKNELRDEKQRLKAEKENLEQQIKLLNARPSFVPHPSVLQASYAAQGKAPAQKLVMPIIGYPGFPMWQFMPPTDVDTSHDAESCPPVA